MVQLTPQSQIMNNGRKDNINKQCGTIGTPESQIMNNGPEMSPAGALHIVKPLSYFNHVLHMFVYINKLNICDAYRKSVRM